MIPAESSPTGRPVLRLRGGTAADLLQAGHRAWSELDRDGRRHAQAHAVFGERADMRVCPYCWKTYPARAFWVQSRRTPGKGYYTKRCSVCLKEHRRARHVRNPRAFDSFGAPVTKSTTELGDQPTFVAARLASRTDRTRSS